MDIHAKSCFRLILLISPRNENQFSILSSYSLSHTLSFSLWIISCHPSLPFTQNQIPCAYSSPPAESPDVCSLSVPYMLRSARMSELWVSRNLQHQQTAEHRRLAPEFEARRAEGEWSERHSGLHNPLRFVLRVFLARSRPVSPLFVGIPPLFQLSPDFPLVTLWSCRRISIPQPGSLLHAH